MKTSTSNQLRDLSHEVESELQGENAQPAQGENAQPDPSVKASRGRSPWHIALATVAICALFAGCAFARFSSLPATEVTSARPATCSAIACARARLVTMSSPANLFACELI